MKLYPVPAGQAYTARYEPTSGGGYELKDVMGWNENGDPLVMEYRTGRLVRADSWSNFARIDERPLGGFFAAIPGSGWRVRYRNQGEDDGLRWIEPVVSWLARADGYMVPVTVGSDGEQNHPGWDNNYEVDAWLPPEGMEFVDTEVETAPVDT